MCFTCPRAIRPCYRPRKANPMSIVRTRIHGVPVVATQPPAANPGVDSKWRVEIAPGIPMPLVPFELRSTYSGPQLHIALLAAQYEIDGYVDSITPTDHTPTASDLLDEWALFRDAIHAYDSVQADLDTKEA